MFWNDPIFYGASFPYRELTPPQFPFLPYRELTTPPQFPTLATTYTPWMNFPKFMPQNFGTYPQVPFAPQNYGTYPQVPFVPQNYGFYPQAPFVPPTAAVNPWLHPYNVNLPMLGGYKPFNF